MINFAEQDTSLDHKPEFKVLEKPKSPAEILSLNVTNTCQAEWLSEQWEIRFPHPIRNTRIPDKFGEKNGHPMMMPQQVMRKVSDNPNYTIDNLIDDLNEFRDGPLNKGIIPEDMDFDYLRSFSPDTIRVWFDDIRNKYIKNNDVRVEQAKQLLLDRGIHVEDLAKVSDIQARELIDFQSNLKLFKNSKTINDILIAIENKDVKEFVIKAHGDWRRNTHQQEARNNDGNIENEEAKLAISRLRMKIIRIINDRITSFGKHVPEVAKNLSLENMAIPLKKTLSKEITDTRRIFESDANIDSEDTFYIMIHIAKMLDKLADEYVEINPGSPESFNFLRQLAFDQVKQLTYDANVGVTAGIIQTINDLKAA